MIILALIAVAIIAALIWGAVTVMIPTCIRAIRKWRAIETDQDRAEFREWLFTPVGKSARRGK